MSRSRQLLCLATVAGILLAVLLVAAGCGGVYTHIVAKETAYYRDGPQQARPADGILAAGTRVRLLSEAGSYSLVETPGLGRVYVATDSLQQLPPR